TYLVVSVNQNVARVDYASPWNFWMGLTEGGVQSPGRLADYFQITADGVQNYRCLGPSCSQASRVNQDAITAFADVNQVESWVLRRHCSKRHGLSHHTI